MTPTASASFQREGDVEVAAVIVTYNSANEIDALLESLRAEAGDATMRVVAVDNSSTDTTLERLADHDDVIVIQAGGNVGYAAGINIAMKHIGAAASVLILNPDLRVDRGAVRALLERLHSDRRVGIVAPMVTDASGSRSFTLFHEPAVTRALCDAVLGSVWRARPAAFSEWVRDPREYASAHRVDWATGAALLVSSEAATAIGEWDERFFLYSEETDFCRRARQLGFEVWFEPAAVVRHAQGGSGSSAELDALLNVNRVRYMRKHSPNAAGLYRAAAVLSALIRLPGSRSQRVTVRYLFDESRWKRLPAGGWSGSADRPAPVASVVIPASNESGVISRTLSSLADAVRQGSLEVVVVCNGCTDDTAQKARDFAGVRVVERAEPSKTGALNHGDEVASAWPRIYLDADIVLPPSAVPTLVRALESPGILAGRPPFEYDTGSAGVLVRAYFRARLRVPSLSQALWGAGVYALTHEGHDRLGRFPDVIADDLHVDQLFKRAEKAIPLSPAVVVRTPRTTTDLLRVLARSRRGPAQQGVDTGPSTLRTLLRSVRGPMSLADAVVYAFLTTLSRRRASVATTIWERDLSSR